VNTKAGIVSVLMTQVAGPFLREDTSKMSSTFAGYCAAYGNGAGVETGPAAKTEGQ
jgi:hypothetical protein